MRREVLIALAVFVPFAALVAAGFWFQPEAVKPGEIPVLPLPQGGEGGGEGASRQAPPDAGAVVLPLTPTLSPAGEREDAGFPPELRAPLTAVLPHVKRCFSDQHLRAPHEVRVRFTPTRDGGFQGVRVDEQNPYLAACLEDVFDEVGWNPEGPETYAPSQHTFSFDPSKD